MAEAGPKSYSIKPDYVDMFIYIIQVKAQKNFLYFFRKKTINPHNYSENPIYITIIKPYHKKTCGIYQ